MGAVCSQSELLLVEVLSTDAKLKEMTRSLCYRRRRRRRLRRLRLAAATAARHRQPAHENTARASRVSLRVSIASGRFLQVVEEHVRLRGGHLRVGHRLLEAGG